MDRIRISGGKQLNGTIQISGAKNAALPLMTACLLTDQPLILGNLPHLADIATLLHLLRELGVEPEMSVDAGSGTGAAGDRITLNAGSLTSTTAPYDLVRRMRASILVLGPLVAKQKQAVVSLPGGCAIGSRPVDLHLKGLEQMGAELDLRDGYVHAAAPNGLRGAEIHFPFVSVGATENLLMAATLAKGTTILDNAAREPEVVDLAKCLVAMGAQISGIGTKRMIIEGVDNLYGAEYAVLPDRIEAGSYATAAVATGGQVLLKGIDQETLGVALIDVLRMAGAEVAANDQGVMVEAPSTIKPVDIVTQPFPGFATDMQAQLMALMTIAEGASIIDETVFENRFMHVPELSRLGADIQIRGHTAFVRGPKKLKGAQVMATDLRASMSLIIAALAAEGDTIVNRVYHLDRGYERLEEKLAAVGADIERLKN